MTGIDYSEEEGLALAFSVDMVFVQDLEIAADFNVTSTTLELFEKLQQTDHVRVSFHSFLLQ